MFPLSDHGLWHRSHGKRNNRLETGLVLQSNESAVEIAAPTVEPSEILRRRPRKERKISPTPKKSATPVLIPPCRVLMVSPRSRWAGACSLCCSHVSVLCAHGKQAQIVHQLPTFGLRQSVLPRWHRCATRTHFPEQFAISSPSHEILVGKVRRLLR
jgi:hypothetical protein